MAKQGFNYIANNPYVYQECDTGKSAATGLDNATGLFKIKAQATAGAAPSATANISIDSAAAGNITITPNGAGQVILSPLGVGAVLSSSTGQLSSTGASTAGYTLTANGGVTAPSFQLNVGNTNSGWATWGGSGNYFDDTTLGDFTVLRPGTGYINGVAVSWAGSQTISGLTAGNTYYIYIDSTGTIGKTTSLSASLFANNIVLFECMRDSTPVTNNQLTVKENHPYNYQSAISYNLHQTIGCVIENHQHGANIVLNGTQKIQINGADELSDHGLYTTIPDSGGVGVSWYKYYTDAGGKWARQNATDTFSGYYNNAGTPTVLGGSKFGVYTLYVSKDNLTSSTPVYVAVLDTSQYNNQAAAQTAISNGTVAKASNELAQLEIARLGYIIYSQASNSIVQVIISKTTVSSGTTTAGTNIAALVLTNTAGFNGVLSAADTNVQAALDTLDDIFVNTASATTSPQVYFKKNRTGAVITSGDLVGTLKFSGYDGSAYIDGARITSTTSGTIAANRIPSNLVFMTHPDSAAADPTTRMTIASTGAVTIAAPDSGVALTITAGGETITSGDLTVTSGKFYLAGSDTGAIYFNSVKSGRISGDQTYWGGDAGGAYGLRTGNTGLGYKTLYNITADASYYNTCVGAYAGYSTGNNGDVDLGCKNVFVGYQAGYSNSFNRYNTAVGYQALGQAGNYAGNNTCLGYRAGYNITGGNQSNICIGNIGAAEQFTMRLGTPGAATSPAEGSQNNCYIAGIYTMGAALGSTAKVVLIDSNAKVGGLAGASGTVLIGGTAPSFTDSPTLTTVNATTFDTNVAAAGVTLAGTTLAADGSDTNINITITPKGTGVISTAKNINAAGISFDSGTNTLASYTNTTAWTPTISFAGGTTGITYGTQSGQYSRIGNICFFSATVILTSKGSSTGNLRLESLPITPAASPATVSALLSKVTYSGTSIVGYVSVSGYFTFYYADNANGAASTITDAMCDNTLTMRVGGFYFV